MLLDRHKLEGHRMWGGALISSLLGNDLPGPGTIYRSQNFEFHKAVELGDALLHHRDRQIQDPSRRQRGVRLPGGQSAR